MKYVQLWYNRTRGYICTTEIIFSVRERYRVRQMCKVKHVSCTAFRLLAAERILKWPCGAGVCAWYSIGFVYINRERSIS